MFFKEDNTVAKLFRMAQEQFNKRNHENTKECYRILIEESDDPKTIANAYLKLVSILRIQNKHEEAKDYCKFLKLYLDKHQIKKPSPMLIDNLIKSFEFEKDINVKTKKKEEQHEEEEEEENKGKDVSLKKEQKKFLNLSDKLRLQLRDFNSSSKTLPQKTKDIFATRNNKIHIEHQNPTEAEEGTITFGYLSPNDYDAQLGRHVFTVVELFLNNAYYVFRYDFYATKVAFNRNDPLLFLGKDTPKSKTDNDPTCFHTVLDQFDKNFNVQMTKFATKEEAHQKYISHLFSEGNYRHRENIGDFFGVKWNVSKESIYKLHNYYHKYAINPKSYKYDGSVLRIKAKTCFTYSIKALEFANLKLKSKRSGGLIDIFTSPKPTFYIPDSPAFCIKDYETNPTETLFETKEMLDTALYSAGSLFDGKAAKLAKGKKLVKSNTAKNKNINLADELKKFRVTETTNQRAIIKGLLGFYQKYEFKALEKALVWNVSEYRKINYAKLIEELSKELLPILIKGGSRKEILFIKYLLDNLPQNSDILSGKYKFDGLIDSEVCKVVLPQLILNYGNISVINELFKHSCCIQDAELEDNTHTNIVNNKMVRNARFPMLLVLALKKDWPPMFSVLRQYHALANETTQTIVIRRIMEDVIKTQKIASSNKRSNKKTWLDEAFSEVWLSIKDSITNKQLYGKIKLSKFLNLTELAKTKNLDPMFAILDIYQELIDQGKQININDMQRIHDDIVSAHKIITEYASGLEQETYSSFGKVCIKTLTSIVESTIVVHSGNIIFGKEQYTKLLQNALDSVDTINNSKTLTARKNPFAKII